MHTIDLINHIWQSTIVGLLILGILVLGRRLSAGTRRALGWIALVKFAVPAIGFTTILVYLEHISIHWFGTARRAPAAHWPLAISPPTFLLKLRAPIFTSSSPSAGPASWMGFGHIAVMISLMISAALFASWVARGLRLRRRILGATAPVSIGMRHAMSLAATRMGLAKAPKCVTTTDGHGPGVLGGFSPVVVLPLFLEETLSPAELESILIHEFIHVRRRDNFWGVLQSLLISVFWFNPVVWLLGRSLKLETEKSCDERVLEITTNPIAYADGIMKAARQSLGLPQLGFAGAASLPLVSRVRSILDCRSRANRPLLKIAAVAVACLFAFLSAYAGAIAEGSAAAENPGGPVAQRPKSPQISGDTKRAFLKVKGLLAAKDYDGVLALLKGLEPSVDKESYDRAVILDTEAKVLWQGKNEPSESIKPWEELLQLVDKYPTYLEPKDRIAHFQYLAQTYYLAASNPTVKDEQLKWQYTDRAMAYMKRWLAATPKPGQDDLLFYATLLYAKATADPAKVDLALLREAQERAEEGSLLTAKPKEQFYDLLATICQQAGEWVPAATYLERIVSVHPTKGRIQELIDSYVKLVMQSNNSPELRREYENCILRTRQRAQALGISLD